MENNKYFGFIQKDQIGNIIDIFTLDEKNYSVLESFRNDENFIVLPLEEAIEFSKKNPRKKFFIFNESEEVMEILRKSGIKV